MVKIAGDSNVASAAADEQLQRTPDTSEGAPQAASASLHCVHAACFTEQRAAAWRAPTAICYANG